uniref:Capsule polysaccharide export-like protein n=1 Tax=Caulobacter sp. (strain K31) TaxID=366602 RepID=B0T6Z5_CAUSK
MDGYAPTITPADDPATPAAEPQVRAARRRRFAHAGPPPAPARPKWQDGLRAARPFLLIVILPTLLVAGFQYLIAANQYQSEAHFIVRSAQPSGGTGGLGQMLGLTGAPSPAEAHSIGDYLLSHDAVAAVQWTMDLPAIFRRPEADPITRLDPAHPPPETLLKYYRRQVSVSLNTETGITDLSVRAFRPADARDLAETLLRLGETRVNAFNQRALANGLSVADAQLREAERGVTDAQRNLTGFRQGGRDIDPERTSTAQITLAANLQQQLAQARAQRDSMAGSVAPDSPQYVAIARQIRALEVQAAAAQGRLAGSAASIAPGLGAYESLRLRQEFAAKRYEAAAASLEAAREQALKQQLFVIRVVEPNLPSKALYPHRLKTVAIVFFGLLLSYAVGWLILAGVREHAG